MKFKLKTIIPLFVASLLLVGCGKKPSVKSVIVSTEGNVQTISEGETLQFLATVHPTNVDQSVTWSVDNISGEATINESGLLSALKMGNVSVVAASKVDPTVKGYFPLSITKGAGIAPNSIRIITSDETTVDIGKTIQLAVRPTPSEASNDVTWSSENETVATVSEAGLVTALGEGKTNITATSKLDATIKDGIEITVTKPDPGPIGGDSDYAKYLAAQKGEILKVSGTCTYVGYENSGKISYYLADGKGGYFISGQSTALSQVVVGNSYSVTGTKGYSQGKHSLTEITNVTMLEKNVDYVISNLNSFDFTTYDGSKDYHGGVVEASDMVITASPKISTNYVSFSAKLDEKEISFRAESSFIGADELDLFKNKLQTVVAKQTVSFKGVLSHFSYNGQNPPAQVLLMKVGEVEISKGDDETVVNLILENVFLQNSLDLSQDSITLPTSSELDTSATFKWESLNKDVIADNGTLVARPTTLTDVQLKLTVTLNDASKSKTFIVTVFDNEVYDTVHTLNFEDALPEGSYGLSGSKPSYAAGDVTLGTPNATWELDNALIAKVGSSDRGNGNWTSRNKYDKNGNKYTLKTDYEFNVLEFKVAPYGTHQLGSIFKVSYSLDSGMTWVDIDRTIQVYSRELESIRVRMPETSSTMRVRITGVANSGGTNNIDDIILLKDKA